jgi:hypothetical protein
MTYTFKLSRRLAISNFCFMLTPLFLLCACTETTDPASDLARGGLKGPLVGLIITPKTDTLIPAEKRLFIAKGVHNNGDTVDVSATWKATGGQITPDGEYNAGLTPGNYRVIGTHDNGTLADTAQVVVSASEHPTLIAIALRPTSVSLSAGATQQFTVSGQMSDGSTNTVNVTYSATGGSITSGGLYTAGQTAGTFRVIATQSGGTLGDTAVVTLTAPPSLSGKTFFSADAENGSVIPPWSWQVAEWSAGAPLVTNSTTRAKNGTRSYKFEISDPAYLAREAHTSQVLSGAPQVSMGSSNGRYLSGYYSWWMYIDAGFTTQDWNMLLGWMTGVSGAPAPIANIELHPFPRGSGANGLQLSVRMQNAFQFNCYAAPTISGYAMNNNGWYHMTSQSPAGVVLFPRQRWVHVAVYYKMAPTNGQITIWQDGTLIMDLAHANLNTFIGQLPCSNTAGDMLLQFGIYEGSTTDGVQRMYVDDFKVTDYRPVP